VLPFLGEHELSIFGPLVVLGVALGFRRMLHYARVRGLDVAATDRIAVWVLVGGFAMAHWVSMLLYFPERVVADPWVLLPLGGGLSSVGGFVGGALAFVIVARRRGVPMRAHADALTFGLLTGFTIGRVGCSLVHDHPGAIARPDDWLAVGPWPDGAWRYDLALVELCGLLVVCAVIYGVFDWRRAPPGRLTAVVAILYSAGRFPLDFLRAVDTRYFGLTPAQFACLAFVGAGVVLLLRTRAAAISGGGPSSAVHPRAPASRPASEPRAPSH
jgi:phosphatidylglycerol:prolipoprotein diacylglycerol transferase